jgi:hypothetical protein
VNLRCLIRLLSLRRSRGRNSIFDSGVRVRPSLISCMDSSAAAAMAVRAARLAVQQTLTPMPAQRKEGEKAAYPLRRLCRAGLPLLRVSGDTMKMALSRLLRRVIRMFPDRASSRPGSAKLLLPLLLVRIRTCGGGVAGQARAVVVVVSDSCIRRRRIACGIRRAWLSAVELDLGAGMRHIHQMGSTSSIRTAKIAARLHSLAVSDLGIVVAIWLRRRLVSGIRTMQRH